MHKLKIVKGTNFKDNRGIVDKRAIFHNKTAGILKNNNGLTLVELIIALAISVIVVAAAGFILLTQSGVIRFNRSVSTEQQRLNTAFNTVRYSLRMAGFDYGQSFYIQAGSVPPVQVVQASYPTNPYEVLVSYSSVVNDASPCKLQKNGAVLGEFDFNSPSCNAANFYTGQILNIINAVPLSGKSLPQPPFVLCVTQVPAGNKIQANTGAPACAGAGNRVPPNNFGGGSVSSVNQVLFYWGAAPYTAPELYDPNNGTKITSPFNIPGNLYECQVAPLVINTTVPTCIPNTTITLSDYINNFAVAPQGYSFSSPLLSYYLTSSSPAGQIEVYYSNGTNIAEPPYLNLSITGESNVALSDSPAYSVNVPYNSNAGGVGAKGNAGQVVGNNVLKTLNSSVFLRNVYYGS
jgi:prepilin-type N-terminal cleavage/methylation domain-containing protein